MSAQNDMTTEMINITATITEVVAEAVNVLPEELLPITIAEILEADFRNDDEAEFLQAVLEIQQDIENVLLSDTPEDFLMPTENDLPPAIIFLEKLEELKSYAFGDRTLARMERRVRGTNEVIKVKMTETDKATHPDYKKCPNCLRHFTKRYIGFHMDTDICVKVATAHNLRPSGNNKTKVSEKIYNACYDLEDLYSRAVAYKKNIEPELVEEAIDEDLHIVSVSAEEQLANDATANVYDEPEVRYKIRCIYQEDEGDDFYEEELGWEGIDYYTTEEGGMSAINDAWTNWSAEAGSDLKMLELIAYNVNGDEEIVDEWIVHTYEINNE